MFDVRESTEMIDGIENITRQDYDGWKNVDKVSQAFFEEINKMILKKALELGNGCTIDFDNIEKTGMHTGFYRGYIQALYDVLDLKPKERKNER